MKKSLLFFGLLAIMTLSTSFANETGGRDDSSKTTSTTDIGGRGTSTDPGQ